MIALLLPADRTKPATAVQGLTFEEVRDRCNCAYFERVPLGGGLCMLVDEDAHMKSPHPPMNTKATFLAHRAIYGDAAITCDEELSR